MDDSHSDHPSRFLANDTVGILVNREQCVLDMLQPLYAQMAELERELYEVRKAKRAIGVAN